ncbi:MAG: RdgB/HAM1 family non-canonical purine NTP pyrophosphatase [Blastocatellia bacterium]
MANFELLAATGNIGKLGELRALFYDLPLNLRGLDEFPKIVKVAETGETFEENACLKAVGYARQTGLIALADDSGLEVEALGGKPGLYSARYGGPGLTDADRISILLDELSETKAEYRNARFFCSMALALSTGEILFSASGECRGSIADSPFGSGGFGYDPVFIPEGYDRSFGELSNSIKGEISHRARASAVIMRYLRDFIVV